MAAIRSTWTREEIAALYHQPLFSLVHQAAAIHREVHTPGEVQVCTLLSVKTGGCPEDCAYCPQAARYQTDVEAHKLMDVDTVVQHAQEAKASGSTRFCMGAAWREVRSNRDFDKVLDMIREVKDLGLEVCATMGMATEQQLSQMKKAGLYAYNHNLDTSEEHYDDIISTRTYQDRLQTLQNIRAAGVTVCCGGIVGMGESEADRIAFLHQLSTMAPHPESVPINALVPVEGTPLEEQERLDTFTMVRMIALARVLMPNAMVRLSAGRVFMSDEAQALCFLAGANSIFAGDKLLTTPNNGNSSDARLFNLLGLTPRPAYKTAGEFDAEYTQVAPEKVPAS